MKPPCNGVLGVGVLLAADRGERDARDVIRRLEVERVRVASNIVIHIATSSFLTLDTHLSHPHMLALSLPYVRCTTAVHLLTNDRVLAGREGG